MPTTVGTSLTVVPFFSTSVINYLSLRSMESGEEVLLSTITQNKTELKQTNGHTSSNLNMLAPYYS